MTWATPLLLNPYLLKKTRDLRGHREREWEREKKNMKDRVGEKKGQNADLNVFPCHCCRSTFRIDHPPNSYSNFP